MKKTFIASLALFIYAIAASAQCGIVYWNSQDGYRFDSNQDGVIDFIIPTQTIGKNISNVFTFDADGDGIFDLCEIDSSEGLMNWYFYYNSGNNTFGEAQMKSFGIGSGVDKQLAGDFNADGIGDIAIRRDNEFGLWWIIHFMGIAPDANRQFGIDTTDYLMTGDFNGDGVDDIICYNAGKWLGSFTPNKMPDLELKNINNLQFGTSRDIPIVGDFDGDGYCDMGLYSGSDDEIGINLHKTTKAENGGYSSNGRGSFDQTVSTPSNINATVIRTVNKKNLSSNHSTGIQEQFVFFSKILDRGQKITFSIKNDAQLHAIQIYDSTSRLLTNENGSNQALDIAAPQQEGIYIIKILTDKGSISDKIMVK